MTRFRAKWGFALLVACGSTATGPQGYEPEPLLAPEPTAAAAPTDIEGRPPRAEEVDMVEELFRTAEHTRGLRLDRAVPVRIQSEAMIKRHLAREIDDEQLTKAAEMYVGLGLLRPDIDVRELLLDVLGEQVVGYYDTRRDFLAVREDVVRELVRTAGRPQANAEARAVLIHEIVHALQDQNMSIRDDFERDLDTDAANALQALIEGDASLAMVAYIAGAGGVSLAVMTRNRGLFERMVDSSPTVLGDELTEAPAIVRVPLLAAYLSGMKFTAELHRKGGWRRIDRAFLDVPTTTEEVLHPDQYPDSSSPAPIVLPAIGELDGLAGVTRTTEDTLGELELSVYFGQGLEGDVDRSAAAGWDGDRLRVYGRSQGPPAIVWLTRWDSERDASEAEAAARRVGTQIVERRGLMVLLARNVPDEIAPAVRRAFP